MNSSTFQNAHCWPPGTTGSRVMIAQMRPAILEVEVLDDREGQVECAEMVHIPLNAVKVFKTQKQEYNYWHNHNHNLIFIEYYATEQG